MHAPLIARAVVAMFALTASAAQAQFTSANYPATASATSTGDVFDAFGTTVKCTNNSFTSGALGNDTLVITPTYSSCTAFGLPATINFTGCYYLFHETTRTVDVVCGSGQIDILVYTSSAHTTQMCALWVPQQTGKSGYSLTNNGDGTVQLTGAVGGLTAHVVHNTSIACPNGPETNEAKYTIQSGGIKVSGNNGAVSVD